MPAKEYHVRLSDEDRGYLRSLLQGGKHASRWLTRARILLLAHEGRNDADIAGALQIGASTVERTRKRYCQVGLEALRELPRAGGHNKKFDGRQEAWLVATVCSPPPEGERVWTLRLLAERMIELGLVESVCGETVRRALKKMNLSPGSTSSGASRR